MTTGNTITLTTGNTITLTRWTFVIKVMSLLFNMLSRIDMGFPGGSDGKESACDAGDLGSIPGLGRSPGGGMAIHSSILAWRIPRTEEPGRLYSPWGHKESDPSR